MNTFDPLTPTCVGVVSQDCSHGAECVTFTCPLTNMSHSATLRVAARLWNATMMEVGGVFTPFHFQNKTCKRQKRQLR